MSIEMNANALNTGMQKLDVVSSSFDSLKNAMSSIDLTGSGLESASLFSEAKKIINNLTASSSSENSINALRDRIKKIRNILIQNDEEMALLFGQFDEMTLEEFGDYADGIYNDGDTVYFDSSLFYDENFIAALKDSINEALFADDTDGKNARKITQMKLMKKGDAGVHTMADTLYVKLSSGHKYYINIKGQVNSDSLVHVIHQGAYDGSAKKMDDLYKNHCDDVDNGIFIRMVNACGTAGITEELDANSSIVKVISDTFSIPFNNTTIEGFSGAQATVMRIAGDIARETGKAPAGVSLVECHTKPHPWSDEDAKALNDVNAVVYAVYGNGNGNGSATKDVFTRWGEKYPGINLVYIDRNKGGHEGIFTDYLRSDMLSFITNKTQFPSEYYASSSKEIFDTKTLSWVNYEMSSKKTNDVFVQLANNNYWSGVEFGSQNEQIISTLENINSNVDDNKLENTTNDSNLTEVYYDDLVYSNIKPKNNSDIAHRGYGVGENTAEAFIRAGEKGFWGCEADIRFDNDGNIVCSHDTVTGNEKPTSFEEYLDICKKYGMTAVIDLKYEVENDEKFYALSPAVLKIIEEKDMMDSCVLQTNMAKDVSNIRNSSNDARIWYLSNEVSDKNVQLMEDNSVECLNLKLNEYNTEQMKKLDKLTESDVDVCIWNVKSQASKDRLLEKGATYVMSDNILGITPYQEGEIDFNNIKGNYDETTLLNQDEYNENAVLLNETENFKNIEFDLDDSSDIISTPEPVIQETPKVEYKEESVIQETPKVEYKEEPVIHETPKVEYKEESVIQQTPKVEYKEEPVIQETPKVEYKEESVIQETPIVEYKEEPVIQETPKVEYKEEPVIQETPKVEYKVESVIQQTPKVEYKEEPVVQETPKVEYKEESVIQETPKVEYKEESVILQNNDLSSGNPNVNKYVLTGIIGTGIALIGSKIGNLIKKSKKNNDV